MFTRRALLDRDTHGLAGVDYGSDVIAGEALRMVAHAEA